MFVLNVQLMWQSMLGTNAPENYPLLPGYQPKPVFATATARLHCLPEFLSGLTWCLTDPAWLETRPLSARNVTNLEMKL